MFVLANNWFTKLIRIFFFWIDKIVYNFIPKIYDLLIKIARTSPLSQGDISVMADRIYKLLAIFMVFKVTFSLIMYVVNPDDFSDKTKGVGKLTTNIIVVLSLLVLTPYAFRMSYELQTIILEDNSLATLVFGTDTKESFLNTAGQDMTYTTISTFFTPNVAIEELYECSNLLIRDSAGEVHVNTSCTGITNDTYESIGDSSSMQALTEGNADFKPEYLKNYVAGIEHNSMGLMFRQDMATALTTDDEFVIDYSFIVSTVTGVVILLLLITFCMDVGVRSIKLAFLQLIAPIPIISYIDPKSGKDGMFKKWYQMCFKTYVSLFVRLLAMYFSIFIISKVSSHKLVDVIDGSYVTNKLVYIFVIIGALMFAKQLPKILEGLGIKLDGDGKFFLNPLKKFDEEAMGGKRVSGAAGGMVAGLIGGHGVGRFGSALTGALRGAAANKGYQGGLARQADVNRKMRDARIQGAGRLGSRLAVLSSRYGLDDADIEKDATNLRKDKRAAELVRRDVDSRVKALEVEKKGKQDGIAEWKRKIADHKKMQDAVSKMETRAKEEIERGNGGDIGKEYLRRKARVENFRNHGVVRAATDEEINQAKDKLAEAATDEEKALAQARLNELITNGVRRAATDDELAEAEKSMNDWLNDEGMKEYMTKAATGKFSDGKDDLTFQNAYKDYVQAAGVVGVKVIGKDVPMDGKELHKQYGESKGTVGDIERDHVNEVEREIQEIDDKIRNIQVNAKVEISGERDPISLEDVEKILDDRDKELKDKKDQRKLNRDTGNNRSIGGSSK